MSEPDPFASPFHQVDLPGRPGRPRPPVPAFTGYPLPMPEVDSRTFAPPRPAALTAAFWCWIVGAVLVVLVLPAVFYTGGNALADELYAESQQTDQDPMSRQSAEYAARLTPVLFGFGFAVPAVLFVIAAFKLRGGQNWARVLLAVLGGMAILFGSLLFLSFVTGSVPYANWLIGTIWSLVFLASVILGVVAMFLPPSNTYLRSVNLR
ncbi:hypothetical protein FHS29_001299 [Saccharothrix tamanrassetensis]|uniref:Uncharacterized protein n=1 Tax=Saccharothrix tamanrassetensis TaxID=1051531 RepID=A0A841CBE6_9PSEU|nr:hypothetical protein [Saccharothrix tamanrassetensis]MBB5954729.1 hypothetical protein [Saccharothrix tamanrassetensis]